MSIIKTQHRCQHWFVLETPFQKSNLSECLLKSIFFKGTTESDPNCTQDYYPLGLFQCPPERRTQFSIMGNARV